MNSTNSLLYFACYSRTHWWERDSAWVDGSCDCSKQMERILVSSRMLFMMSLHSSSQDSSLEESKEDRPSSSHLSTHSGTDDEEPGDDLSKPRKYTITVGGKYSVRRLLGQFTPSTGRRTTILADKVWCRNCTQFCAGKLHLQSNFSTRGNELYSRVSRRFVPHRRLYLRLLGNRSSSNNRSSRATRHLWESVFQDQETGAGSAKRAEREPTDNFELPSIKKLKWSTESTVEKEPEFKVDLRIEGIAEDAIFKDEERMGKIQVVVVGKLRNGSRTRSILEDLGKPEISLRFSE